jgi:D-alanyl-D-alanine carboxypeptidase
MVGLAALAAVGITVPASARVATTPPVAYLVMDADTGAVLAEHEAHKHWPRRRWRR